MARTFQLDPVPGLLLDPGDVFHVDRSGATARRATQQQIVRALLSQPNDGAVSFPSGSYGSLLLAGTAGLITAFASTPGPVAETGATVTNPTLTWAMTPTNVVSQSLAGPLTSGVALTTAQRSTALSGNVATDATWTLTVNTGSGTLTRQCSLQFGHTIHYGRGVVGTPNAATILALTGAKLATGAAGDYAFVANPGSQPYWWFCYPDSWGALVLTDLATGLPVAMSDAGTVSVTNASGHTRAFRCLRSLNALNGAMTVRIS